MIAVIGGGAAGLMAAIFAARKGKEVVIFERGERVGRKILATGNGRCNLTNQNMDASHFHGGAAFAEKIISRFSKEETLAFFDGIGIVAKELENGRIYPRSLQAASVLDSLRYEAARFGVKESCGQMITQIKKQKDGFLLSGREPIKAEKVIVTVGGAAAPKLGTDGEGYRLLTGLGHTKTKLFPALVQVKCDSRYTKQLNGIKVDAVASLYEGKNLLAQEAGEVLFTNYGLSGPPIFSLSRLANEKGRAICLDLMPEFDEGTLLELLKRRAGLLADAPAEFLFGGVVNKQVGRVLLKDAGVLAKTINAMTQADLAALARRAKALRFPVSGTTGFQNAQVTAGGIKTDEFDENLQSKLCSGVYAAGEVLDVDGDCGGYNLQWAWSSGAVAGGCCASS